MNSEMHRCKKKYIVLHEYLTQSLPVYTCDTYEQAFTAAKNYRKEFSANVRIEEVIIFSP